MTTDAVRTLIREVLAEELGRIAKERGSAKANTTEEFVTIASDDDLQSFARHVLKLSRSKTMGDKIAKGEHVFRLGNTPERTSNGQTGNAAPTALLGDVVQIEKGFLSERRVETLPQGTRVVQLGKGVRFTPLARDRLRQRKIVVERIK